MGRPNARDPSLVPSYVAPEELSRRFILANGVQAVTTATEVYFDDSGCGPGAKVFLWSGYFAKYDDWVGFSKDWREVLSAAPELPFWHQLSARERYPERRKPPFSSLSTDQLRDKELGLAKVIAKHNTKICSITVRLPLRYHAECIEGKTTFGQQVPGHVDKDWRFRALERPHFVCFSMAAITAARLAQQTASDAQVAFFFESRENDPYQTLALQLYSEMGNAMPWLAPHLGELSFKSGKAGSPPPLQAADMLAWHQGQRAYRTGIDDEMWDYVGRTQKAEFQFGRFEADGYRQIWARQEARFFGREVPPHPMDDWAP